jgi:uncharacterized protein (TIGR01777 family)
MHIVLAGSHGLIGTAVISELRRRGDTVHRLVRGAPERPEDIRWDPDAGRLDPGSFDGVDAVVNLAGVNVGTRRLTSARKRAVILSRTRTTGLLSTTLAGLATPPPVLLQASGIGAYGDRGDDVLDESEPLGETFFAGVVRQWEAATAPAERAGVRVAHLRSGIVLAQGGGALARIMPLVRAGLAGPLGSGRQYWSWITLTDEVRAILHLLDAPVSGPVNLVATAATNAEVTSALARAVHRPAVVPVPAWAVRLGLGDFSQEILGSVRAVPRKLTESGFTHVHPEIEQAAAFVTASH